MTNYVDGDQEETSNGTTNEAEGACKFDFNLDDMETKGCSCEQQNGSMTSDSEDEDSLDPKVFERRFRNMCPDLVDEADDEWREQPGKYRDDDPINEFLASDSVTTAAFPTVFMFGTAYNTSFGKLGDWKNHHLLNQFTRRPAKDRRLLGYLYDSQKRYQVITGVNAYVRNNQASIDVISNLMNNPEEKEALLEAANNPGTQEASDILEKYKPHLSFASKKISYGCFEDGLVRAYIKEHSTRFSTPSGLLTFSFDDANNPRAIRSCFATIDNSKFPAKFEAGCPYGDNAQDFIHKMQKASVPVHSGSADLSAGGRAALAMDDPVAFVTEVKEMFCDVCRLLLGGDS